jgi:hypothetical protein
MSTDVPQQSRRWTGRWAWVTAAVVVVVLGAIVWAALAAGGDEDRSAAAGTPAASSSAAGTSGSVAPTGTPTPAPTSAATPASTAPVDPVTAAEQLPPFLPAVALDQPASVGGLSIEVASVEAINGQAKGPGNVAGPALRVTLRISNGTDAAAAVDAVAVNLAYGPDAAAASPLEDPSESPFTGSVAPGGTAEGTYVFSVPTDGRDPVSVSVGHAAAAPIAVFTGSIG